MKEEKRIYKLIGPGENPLKAIPEVPTQKEVIERVRRSTSFCIVYMQYAVPNDNVFFHPYYLETSDYQDLDTSNYMTMTPCGVTQYTNEMIFTKLKDWDNEYTIFVEMKNLNFFKYFRVLGMALLLVQWECCDMYLESFADLSVDMDVNFFYFIENQIRRYEYIRDRLIRFRRDVLQIVSLACHRALWDRGFTWDDSNIPPLTRKYGKWIGGLSYTEKANKRKFCERLAAYVKLIDYMKNDMLYRLNKRSFTKMSEMMQIHSDFTPSHILLDSKEHDQVLEIVPRKIDRCRWALFQLEVDLLHNGTVILIPSREVLCKYMECMTNYWDDAIRVFHNYLNEPEMQKFVQPTIMGKRTDWTAGEAPNLYFMMNQDHSMLEHMANVLRVIHLGYDSVWRFLARFNALVDLYLGDLEMVDEDVRRETDLQIMRSWLINFWDQYAAIDNIQPYQPLGLFFVSLVPFQHSYLPLPHHLVDVLNVSGPDLGRRVIDELNALDVKVTAILLFYPTTLEEKEEYDVTIIQTQKEVTYLENRFEYLRELYDLLGEYNLSIPPEDFEDYMSLSMVCTRLRNGIDARMEVMGISLEDEIDIVE